MRLAEFQRWTDRIDREDGWDALPLVHCSTRIAEEIGELSESISGLYLLRGKEQQAHRDNIAHEIVDVLWFLVKIANRLEIDIESETDKLVERSKSWPRETYREHLRNCMEYLAEEMEQARNTPKRDE